MLSARRNSLAIPWLVVSLAACNLVTPSAEPTSPVALYFENRGGPPLDVSINQVHVLVVACDGYPTLVPSEGGLPALPWAVTVTRNGDGEVVYSGLVATLPAWFVQIGNSVLGFGFTPVAGPGGPSCPAA